MAAVYVSNIVINQGADFSQVFNLADSSNDSIDLTNYSFTAQMRKHAGSSVSVNLNPTLVDLTVNSPSSPSDGIGGPCLTFILSIFSLDNLLYILSSVDIAIIL